MSFYDNEPSGPEWYGQHNPDEQAEIDRDMEQCPNCGEYVSKRSRVLEKNGGICRICRRKEEGYEQI